MTYYLIRHKSTSEFMPQLRRGRGYSHWNPSAISTLEAFNKNTLIGTPRLLPSIRAAQKCIIQWNATPNGKQTGRVSYSGDWDDIVDTKPDGRTKDDLEIIEVELIIK